MGYRSCGAIWLPEKTYDKLPAELKDDLECDWKQSEEDSEVWEFEDWKWYSSYTTIAAWEAFMRELDDEEYDFVLLGEQTYDIEVATYNKFSTSASYHFD